MTFGKLIVLIHANEIHTIMNAKRNIGLILVILSIIGLIYAAAGYVQGDLISRATVSSIFFIAGISLVRKTGNSSNKQLYF